jgi:hypothetical protein
VANTQSQYGFKHVGFLPGGAPDYQLQSFTIASTYSTAIGYGDPVTFSLGPTPATGTIIQATAANATTQPLVGVFQGCNLIPTTGGAPVWSPFWPAAGAAANATAYLVSAPNALFQAATFSAAIGTADIGKNVNFTGGVPNTTGGGYSIATLDQTTLTSGMGTTSSFLPFKVFQLYPGIGNGSDPTTNFNWVIVGFNFQMNRTLTHG